MANLLNNRGNVQDIRNSIDSGWGSISEWDLKLALKDEQKNRNRSSVIKLLEVAIRKKKAPAIYPQPELKAIKVDEENGEPVMIEVFELDELLSIFSQMKDDAAYSLKRAKSPKAQRQHTRFLKTSASTVFYLNKLKEVSHG